MSSLSDLQTELARLKRQLTGLPQGPQRTRIENRMATVQAQVDKRVKEAGGRP